MQAIPCGAVIKVLVMSTTFFCPFCGKQDPDTILSVLPAENPSGIGESTRLRRGSCSLFTTRSRNTV
jgi:hypothetical protein